MGHVPLFKTLLLVFRNLKLRVLISVSFIPDKRDIDGELSSKHPQACQRWISYQKAWKGAQLWPLNCAIRTISNFFPDSPLMLFTQIHSRARTLRGLAAKRLGRHTGYGMFWEIPSKAHGFFMRIRISLWSETELFLQESAGALVRHVCQPRFSGFADIEPSAVC